MSWIKDNLRKIHAKIVREKAPPEFIARGWALGVFLGFTVPFGFQLAISIPVAFVIKGSRVGATVGTFVTNHFTIFIIYPVQCWLGNRLMGGNLSYGAIECALREVVDERSFGALAALGEELVQAFFLGGFALAAVFAPLAYWAVLRTVRRYRARKSV